MLDAGPLGLVTNANRRNLDAHNCAKWLQSLLRCGIRVCIPEVSDYEVRRSLLRIGSLRAIDRLDQLNDSLHYLPLSTYAMRQAAEFWATARKQGTPTADNAALDGDMVLVGQVHDIERSSDKVVVATTNVRHINLFKDARHWHNIDASDFS